MNTKIFFSLDFEAAKSRLKAEKYDVGNRLVHTEDFLSLEDLVRRAIRSGDRFGLFEHENEAYYDSVVNVDTDKLRSQLEAASARNAAARQRQSHEAVSVASEAQQRTVISSAAAKTAASESSEQLKAASGQVKPSEDLF
ncbi:hypothetical protein [Capybara microvirus Cap1_SP_259]|nr:hypothetical protein [Capybara microvirus Cap1_SP_259]